MRFSDEDLAKLRKDIERVRRHEESRKLQPATEEQTTVVESASSPPPQTVSFFDQMRQMIGSILMQSPSDESLEAIPDHIVTLLQVIREQPKFGKWLLALESLPPRQRNEELRKMSFAFRIEDKHSSIADSFDRLQNPSLFKAFCQVLGD